MVFYINTYTWISTWDKVGFGSELVLKHHFESNTFGVSFFYFFSQKFFFSLFSKQKQTAKWVASHLPPFVCVFSQGGAGLTWFSSLDHYRSLRHSSLIIHGVHLCVCVCVHECMHVRACMHVCKNTHIDTKTKSYMHNVCMSFLVGVYI